MEFIVEMIFEVFAEIFVDVFYELMSLFGRDCKKIKKEKLRVFIIYEMVVLVIMFFFGLFLSLANGWSSILWKTVFIISVAVPAVQITAGLILTLVKKLRKNQR